MICMHCHLPIDPFLEHPHYCPALPRADDPPRTLMERMAALEQRVAELERLLAQGENAWV